MSTTIEDRVILVLRAAEDGYGFWKRLEEQTGISAARWRKVFTGQQRPTPDILQALCRLKPEYAFWIATGVTDAENGHKAPQSALAFPEWRGEHASDGAAVEFFQASLEVLELLDLAAFAADVNVQDRATRLDAFGCALVREDWQPHPTIDAAARRLHEDVDPILKGLSDSRRALRDASKKDPGLGLQRARAKVTRARGAADDHSSDDWTHRPQ